MLLTIAIVLVLGATVLLIWDLSDQKVIASEYQSFFTPLRSETTVRHTYNAKAESVWEALTELSNYNLWFPGVRRMFPVVDAERYVHKFSFDQFDFYPGAFIYIRPNAVSPSFRGRIMTVEENKELTLSMRFGPLNKETVTFSIDPQPDGSTVVMCRRTSRGLFSFLTLMGFAQNKSHILSNLGYFIPDDKKDDVADKSESDAVALSPEQELSLIAHAVQAGLAGNMDPINAIVGKPARGKAKSLLVRAKRAGGKLQEHLEAALKDGPPPDAAAVPAQEAPASSLPSFSSDDDLIAYVVNKAIAGDMDPINSIQDKALRGKAKSVMVRAKRSGNVPPMPDNIPETAATETVETASGGNGESEDDIINKLVAEGLAGNMDSINALEDRALRAKVKSALVKAKRAQN